MLTVTLMSLSLMDMSFNNTRAEAAGQSFYVSPTGNDSSPGTEAQPWKTLAKAGAAAAAGDTVIFKDGTYSGELIPARSGTTAAPIVFKAQNKGKAVFTGSASYGQFTPIIKIAGKSYITIDGFHVKPQDTEYARWILVDKSGSTWSSHIMISNNTMEHTASGWNDTNPAVFRYVTQIKLVSNVFREALGGRDMITFHDATHIVVEGNDIGRASHSPINFSSDIPLFGSTSKVVMRNNVFHAEWGRNFEVFQTPYVLFEGNIVTDQYQGTGAASPAESKIYADPGIVRFNRFFRNWTRPLDITHYDIVVNSSLPATKNVMFYNNIFDNNNQTVFTSYSDKLSGNVFKNNVFSMNDKDGANLAFSFWKGFLFDNNMFWSGEGIEPYFKAGENRLIRKLYELQPSSMFVGNTVADPKYKDAANYNYIPGAGSPLVDGGKALAFAANAGSGTSLKVDNIRYFYDGWSIEGEQGDLIAIGSSSNRARIVAIDEAQNTLQLDRTVSWQQGDGVSLAWSGSAPDMGAFESGTEGRAEIRVEVAPFTAKAGSPVQLKAAAVGGFTPISYTWSFGDGTEGTGSQANHTYSEPGKYAVFMRAVDASGKALIGNGYVNVVASDPTAPLFTSDFSENNNDWWKFLYGLRGNEVHNHEIINDPDTQKKANHIFVIDNYPLLEMTAHPAEWDIDKYPLIKVKYKIAPGTPLGFYVKAFDGLKVDRFDMVGTGREMVLASAAAAEMQTPYTLIDDGQWHTLEADARLIRDQYPDVNVLQLAGFKALYFPEQGEHEYFIESFHIMQDTQQRLDTWYAKQNFSGVYSLGAAYTNSFTTTFDFTPLSNGIDGIVGYAASNVSQPSWNNLAIKLRLDPKGYFEAVNGSNFMSEKKISYRAGQTYHVRVVVDMSQKYYNLYITPPGKDEVKIAHRYAFEDQAAGSTANLGKMVLITPLAKDYSMRVINHAVDTSAVDPGEFQNETTSGINLIPNPGFEGSGLGSMNPWNNWWTAGAASITTEQAKSGSHSLKLVTNGDNQAGVLFVDVEPNKDYVLKLYAKASAANSVLVKVTTDNFQVIKAYPAFTQSNGFKEYSYKFNSGNRNKIAVTIWDVGAGAQVYIDDLSLEKVI